MDVVFKQLISFNTILRMFALSALVAATRRKGRVERPAAQDLEILEAPCLP